MSDPLAAAMAGSSLPEIEVRRHYPFKWFDIGAVGTGEMILNVEWVFMVFIVSLYGLGLSLVGLAIAFAVMLGAYYLYRELISAVPEPGWFQSYAREAGHAIRQKSVFSLGSSMFILYVVVFLAFLWGEMHVLTALGQEILPGVPKALWPFIMVLPMTAVNLMGHQITAKIQTILVAAVLLIDLIMAVALLFYLKTSILSANFRLPKGVDFSFANIFTAAGFWLAIYVGYEISIVVLDEWHDVWKGIRIGLPLALFGVLLTYLVILFAILGTTPISEASGFALPQVDAIKAHLPYGFYVLMLIFALIASHTSINIFFMACGKQVAMYAQQGALPRIFGAYSSRGAVPWFAICVLSVLTIGGAYVTTNSFILAAMSTFATTYYTILPLFYLAVRRNALLPRPVVGRYGTIVAWILFVVCAIMLYFTVKENVKAAAFWLGLMAFFVLYDYFVVPRTARGRMYRTELLRSRGSGAQLDSLEAPA